MSGGGGSDIGGSSGLDMLRARYARKGDGIEGAGVSITLTRRQWQGILRTLRRAGSRSAMLVIAEALGKGDKYDR